MTTIIIIFSIFLVIVGSWYLYKQYQRKQREKIYHQPFPAEWTVILENNFPLYLKLPDELKQQLQSHINVFINEKAFYGCDDLEVTDEIRVTIAAQACILLLNKPGNYFPNFQTILVYPGKFMSTQTYYDGYIQGKHKTVRLGESWRRGPVVISWQDAKAGAQNSQDGENVVMHEFAHKLDEENPDYEGLPVLSNSAHYESWAKVMSGEYNKLQQQYDRGHKDLIDHYGATSPAEFFAVITEIFFERPRALQNKHSALYEELVKFYRVNPKNWYKSKTNNSSTSVPNHQQRW